MVGCGGQANEQDSPEKPATIAQADCSPEAEVVGTTEHCVVARGRFRISTDELQGCSLHYYEYTCLSVQTVPVYLQGEFKLVSVPAAECLACDGKIGEYEK